MGACCLGYPPFIQRIIEQIQSHLLCEICHCKYYLYNRWLLGITIMSDQENKRYLHSCRKCNLCQYQLGINEYVKLCLMKTGWEGKVWSPKPLYHNIWKWAVWSYFDLGPSMRERRRPHSLRWKICLTAISREGTVALQQNNLQVFTCKYPLTVVCRCWFTLAPLVSPINDDQVQGHDFNFAC